ncbi:hypothetical protein PTKU46_66870 [Paraburkholderia terrae]|uniref:hypothetical protein n=1 Tax=Paraburkholderia terrae TaxID=311230 RepID=UPI00296AC007|nr:hypothetical protein [Paraburkholderia terrae]MDW3660769.1 hypothetical protein [Paraburkholderia terrae]
MKKVFVGLDLDVKGILLHEWDPIGISDSPEAEDEYDSYVPHVSNMLRQQKTPEELYAYLRWIEVERICLDGDEAHTRNIANKLAGLPKD